jgi:hypothetical protein
LVLSLLPQSQVTERRSSRGSRRFFIGSLKRVQSVHPEAKLKVGNVGVILLPSKPHPAQTSVAVSRR